MDTRQYVAASALAAALTGAFLDGDLRRHGAGLAVGVPEPPSGLHRAAVHQATGMISVQLGVTLQEAHLRLRAHAYGSEPACGLTPTAANALWGKWPRTWSPAGSGSATTSTTM
jgi:hypothetical protein